MSSKESFKDEVDGDIPASPVPVSEQSLPVSEADVPVIETKKPVSETQKPVLKPQKLSPEPKKPISETKLLQMRLQEDLEIFESKNAELIENIKKIDTIKKDKEGRATLETLESQLISTVQNIKQIEKEIKDAQEVINDKLGRKGAEAKKITDPEEMEMAYELKSQLLKNVEMQNQKLKTEFTLHEKMTESRMLSQQNRRLHDDVTLSRANSIRLIKMFEKKAKEADSHLKDMKDELRGAQDLAEKYRNLYELERRKNAKEGEILPPVVEITDARLPQNPSSYTFLGGNVRVNDVIRKNEVLTEENRDLRGEIKRLKEDNGRLIKKTKQALADRDTLMHSLETSEANRRNLLKRVDKEKGQYKQLSRSLTRQASDWILLKKQIAQFDEEYRWSQVGTINPQTAENRLQAHPAVKNVYMPRRMFPVEQYDKAGEN